MIEPLREGKQNFLLRQAREELRFSQLQVAEAIGVDERTYRRWENEGHIPSWYAQRKLLTLFRKETPDELGFRKRGRRTPLPSQLPYEKVHEEANQESKSLSETAPDQENLSMPAEPPSLSSQMPSASTHESSQPGSLPPQASVPPHGNNAPRKSLSRRALSVGLVLAILVAIIAGAVSWPFISSLKKDEPKSNIPSYPPHTQPAFNDPLQGTTSHAQWTDSSDNNGTCTFKQGSYHVTARMKTSHYCSAQHATYTNVIYEVNMTFFRGSEGGLIFGESNGNFSVFKLFDDGVYGIYAYHAQTDTSEGSFTRGRGPIMPSVFGQSDRTDFPDLAGETVRLAVIVHNGHCDLYVNQHLIESGIASLYKSGHIGVFASAEYNSHTIEMAFNDARVWTL